MEFTLDQIALLLQGKVEGDGQRRVHRLDKIQEGQEGGISFLANPKYEMYLYSTRSSAVIVSEDLKLQKEVFPTLIRVKNPYLAFTKLLEAYSETTKRSLKGVEEPSFIGEGSQMGENGYRGAFSYIGKSCSIGSHVIIHPHVYIGDRVKIGDYTILHSGVKIYSETEIGENCELHAGAIVGSDGFGFAPQKDGTYRPIPQIGKVIIGDYVSIGANTTVDCGTMGATEIHSGVKIDNLVQIAHNVVIGENTVIAAQAGISGSTEIGKNCVIAGKVSIVGHLKIADKTTIGGATGVTKSITKSGQTLFGFLAMDLKEFLKSYAIFKKLPEIAEKVKELEKKQ
jgi:UDP-3-O-[3-hydroxymyristoyl] glucosamine N-acyltransferase